ncbi:MAG: restriction endonuclease subunit S [Alicyclobacillus sp.]|nr:restriction endonuclease subunit S [Alicyclobacillus sp.]
MNKPQRQSIDFLRDNWRVARLKHYVQINPTKSEISRLPEETEVSFLPMEAVSESGEFDETRSGMIADYASGYTYFRDGDVLLAKITPCFENGKTALVHGLKNGIGFGSTEFHVLRAKDNMSPLYLSYVVRSHILRSHGEASMIGAAGQKRVPESFLSEFKQPFPPLEEQKAIASFLDTETAKLDQLVEKKKRLIELLQEKRQALITQAVTKGLDPNVPMKDSGIPWLGEVPAHWDIVKISRVAVSIQTGPFGSQLHAEDYVDDGIPVINPSHLIDGDIAPDPTCTVSPATKQRLIRHELMRGDIVFARRGEIGRCALVTESAQGFLCGTGCFRLRLNSQIVDPAFVAFSFSTPWIRDWLLIQSVGSTMDNLNTGILAGTPLLVPPVSEQLSIVQRIREISKTINQATSRLEHQVVLLREYRQALITAAVTGQIDVRQYAAHEATPVSS